MPGGAGRQVPFNAVDEIVHVLDTDAEPWSIQLEVRTKGSPDEDRLRDALREAMQRHPMARARKAPTGRSDEHQYEWEIPPEAEVDPLRVVECPDDDALDEVRAELQSRGVPLAESPPVRVRLARHPGGDVLMVNANHAAMDGFGTLRFVQSVARTYADVPDLRGHGRGLRSDKPLTLEAMCDDVAAPLDHVGLGAAVLVGYSMGGSITLLTWRHHRDRVAGLVLMSTALEWRTRLRERGDPSDIAAAGRGLSAFDAHDFAREVDVPTSVVVTARDRLIRAERQRDLGEAIPGAHLVEVDGGHNAWLVKPDEFSTAVDDALRHVLEAAAPGTVEAAEAEGTGADDDPTAAEGPVATETTPAERAPAASAAGGQDTGGARAPEGVEPAPADA